MLDPPKSKKTAFVDVGAFVSSPLDFSAVTFIMVVTVDCIGEMRLESKQDSVGSFSPLSIVCSVIVCQLSKSIFGFSNLLQGSSLRTARSRIFAPKECRSMYK
jgi:hypothetical protein